MTPQLAGSEKGVVAAGSSQTISGEEREYSMWHNTDFSMPSTVKNVLKITRQLCDIPSLANVVPQYSGPSTLAGGSMLDRIHLPLS